MRRVLMAVSIAAFAVAAVGCSSTSPEPSAADSAFVQDMASSGSASMFMADQARTRAADPAVREVANEVFKAVTPIMDRLTDLGPALAADGADGFAHDDEGQHDQESANRADQLRATAEQDFDEAAVELLSQELRSGRIIAQRAQDNATDERTREIADESVATWTLLIERIDQQQ